MGDILHFPPSFRPSDMILSCNKCEEVEFYLVADGSIQCAECETSLGKFVWGYQAPETPDLPPAA